MTLNDQTETAFASNQGRRDAVRDTVGALADRLKSPAELAQTLGESTRSGAMSISHSLRTRPIPFAMTAIGMIWLVAGAGQKTAASPTTADLIQWEDEGGPSLPPEEDAAQIHQANGSTLPALALGAGALAVGALMADALRREDPLRGKAEEGSIAALFRRQTTAALEETEQCFRGLIGDLGKGAIDELQQALSRFLVDAQHAVDTVARPKDAAMEHGKTS